MTNSFLDAARQGKSDWWRYLVGIVLIIFVGLVPGGIAVGLIAAILILQSGQLRFSTGEEFSIAFEKFLDSPTIPAYIVNHIPFLFFLLALIFVIKVLHGRPLITLVSSDRRFSFRRWWVGFGVWWLLTAGLEVVSYWLDPRSYVFNANPLHFFSFLFAFVPLILLITPLQAMTEELFFRGYLIQGLGLLTRQPLLLRAIGGLLFAIPHFGNPEMLRGGIWMGLSYFALGVFWVHLTLKDNRLELALGGHTANNLYIALISNTTDSALKTPALFVSPEPPDPRMTFGVLLIMMAISHWFFFRQTRIVRKS
jgi:uncharacterized protein